MKQKTAAQLVSKFWGAEINANQVTIEKKDEKIVLCIEPSLSAKACMFFYQCIEQGMQATVTTRPSEVIEMII